MEWLADPNAWVALATLTALEIVLGVDNIIFISILCGRLPEHQRAKARTIGLMFAMLTRIGLLFTLTWLMTLTAPLFSIFAHELSGRDLILISGGLFLIWKSVHEIHNSLEGPVDDDGNAAVVVTTTFAAVIAQIAVIDIVFSLDSVITAVGMVDELSIMVIAIVIAVGVMLFSAGAIGAFVDRHPTIKMLALSFLIMIGLVLVADAAGLHIPKGYIYFAMAFSVAVEKLNLRTASKKMKARAKALETK